MKSQPFFRELYNLIKSDANMATDVILGNKSKEESGLIRLSDEDIQLLQSINITASQATALRKAFFEMGRSLIFGILCIIDGVSYTSEDIPDLALVNRSTGEPINQDFLHDEFYEALPDD